MASALEVYPSDASLWLEFGGMYDAPNLSINLFPDGDMEMAGVVNYPAFGGATISKQPNGHNGTQCLRCARAAGSGTYGASPAVVASGKNYVITGYARGDGTAFPIVEIGNTAAWFGTSSTDWQYFRWEQNSGVSTLVYLHANTNGYVEFDDVRISPVCRSIDNLATRGDAPQVVVCGDGTTANTIPGQASGKRGVVFDASTKYIDTSLLYPTLRSQQFTVFALIGLYGQAFWGMCGTRAGDGSALGFDIQLGTAATTTITTLFSNDASANKYLQAQSVLPTNLVAASGGVQLVSVAVTYNGTGVAAGIKHYANGSELAKSTLMDSLGANDFASPNAFRIGKRASLGGAAVRQDMYAFALFPMLASQLQIQNLHKSVMRRINL